MKRALGFILVASLALGLSGCGWEVACQTPAQRAMEVCK